MKKIPSSPLYRHRHITTITLFSFAVAVSLSDVANHTQRPPWPLVAPLFLVLDDVSNELHRIIITIIIIIINKSYFLAYACLLGLFLFLGYQKCSLLVPESPSATDSFFIPHGGEVGFLVH
jgi:hypothetical protein